MTGRGTHEFDESDETEGIFEDGNMGLGHLNQMKSSWEKGKRDRLGGDRGRRKRVPLGMSPFPVKNNDF